MGVSEARPLSADFEAAIERAVAALGAACEAAMRAPLTAGAAGDDPTWLRTEMDRWTRVPPEIGALSQLGQLQVAVHWEQRFEVCAHPRGAFASLAEVVAYYRRCAHDVSAHPGMAARWRMLLPDGVPRPAHLDAQRERWRRFAREQRCVAQDGALYVDLADLLRDALCRWTGHWTFDGVVLDRYADGVIDYGYYFRERFRAPEVAARFERFRDQLSAAGINRETTWGLFSPSGERVWRLAAVFAMDGNTDAFLLESDGAYLDVYASGS